MCSFGPTQYLPLSSAHSGFEVLSHSDMVPEQRNRPSIRSRGWAGLSRLAQKPANAALAVSLFGSVVTAGGSIGLAVAARVQADKVNKANKAKNNQAAMRALDRSHQLGRQAVVCLVCFGICICSGFATLGYQWYQERRART